MINRLFAIAYAVQNAAVPGCIMLLALCMLSTSILAEETGNTTEEPRVLSEEEEIAQLIEELGSPSYETREAATEKLKNAPAEIAPQLKIAANRGDLEVTLRAILILEHMYERVARDWFLTLIPYTGLQPGQPVFAEHPVRTQRLETLGFHFDQLDLILSEMGENPSASQAVRARQVLLSQKPKREFKAMLDVIEHGGKFFFMQDSGRGQDLVPITRDMVLRGEFETNDLGIQINRHWQKSPESLQKLKRISRLRSVYLIKGAPLDRADINELQVALPQIRLHSRSGARLGVTHMTSFNIQAEGALVGEVSADSAAEGAGIKPGDIIIRLGDAKVTDFEGLVRSLEKYEAGDIVEVELIRSGSNLKLPVELSGW
ncbi:MAG: PDZ domain-containing protein [Planctomycetaceae bacterium]